MLRELAREFQIDALCFHRSEPDLDARELSRRVHVLSELARVSTFPVPSDRNVLSAAVAYGRSLLDRSVYTRFVYRSAVFRESLQRLLDRQSFQLIHIDSLDLSLYAGALAGHRVVCVHHDIQSELLRRRGDTLADSGRPLHSWYTRLQSRWMAEDEATWCPRFTLNVTVSERDRRSLSDRFPGAATAVVPNGVDVDYFRPERGGGQGLLCMGGLDWFPNADALRVLAEDILPRLGSLGSAPRTRWVGRCPERVQREWSGTTSLELVGRVRDVRPFLWETDCFVVPLRVGGGTRLKILEAWACGLPVVSTPVGCEGLNAVDGYNLLVADDPSEFARAVRRVLQDRELARALGQHGRQTAVDDYDWRTIGKRQRDLYHEAMAGPPLV